MDRRDISIVYKIQLSKSNVGRTHPNWFWCWCRCWCVFHEKHPDDNGRRGKGADGMPGTCGSWAWCEKWKQKLNEILCQTRRDQKREWEYEWECKGEWVMRGGSAKKGFDRRRIVMLMSWRLRGGRRNQFQVSRLIELNRTELIVGLSVCQLADRVENLLLLFDVLIWVCRVC